MTGKRLVFRRDAERDTADSIEYYRRTAGERVALDFIEALQDSYRFVAGRPTAGSPRYAHLLGIKGLRAWSLRRFPFMVFYFDAGDTIDVWRVLHTRRDIAASLGDPSDDAAVGS